MRHAPALVVYVIGLFNSLFLSIDLGFSEAVFMTVSPISQYQSHKTSGTQLDFQVDLFHGGSDTALRLNLIAG